MISLDSVSQDEVSVPHPGVNSRFITSCEVGKEVQIFYA
jgi:hypothetical protein